MRDITEWVKEAVSDFYGNIILCLKWSKSVILGSKTNILQVCSISFSETVPDDRH